MTINKILGKCVLAGMLLAGCSNTNIGQKTDRIQLDNDFITQGWKVVCVGGGYYLTGTGFLGGCGAADIDYIVLDVPINIGQGINVDNENDDRKFNKFTSAEMKHHAEKAVKFYSIAGVTCNCPDGTRVFCNSDIVDCEGLCDEVKSKLVDHKLERPIEYTPRQALIR